MDNSATAVRYSEHNGVSYKHVNFGLDVEMRGSDGSYAHWNLEHYKVVRKARQERGLMRTGPDCPAVAHLLVGRTLVDNTTGVRYQVEKVVQDWWRGHFLMAVMSRNGSHRTCLVENQSCLDPDVITQITNFGSQFQLEK